MRVFDQLNHRLKARMRDAGRLMGLEVRATSLKSRDDLRLGHFLHLHAVQVVLDVGANKGQFARELFASGYTGKIVSFELLPGAHAQLTEAAKSFGGRWLVAPAVALSDASGFAQFHVTAADTSSSLYAPSDDVTGFLPQARVVETIEVPTARLDDVVLGLGLGLDGVFIKLDVQGAEKLVLSGAPNTLGAATGVLAELSLQPVYDDQPLYREVLDLIHEAGFELWDIWPSFRHPQDHRLTQMDAICFKPPLART